jgi:hypothetical protein
MGRLLTHIDRFTTSLRPLNYLLEQVVEKIVPHQKAQACGAHFCQSVCSGTCQNGHDVWLRAVHIFTNQPNCQGGEFCREYACDNCESVG